MVFLFSIVALAYIAEQSDFGLILSFSAVAFAMYLILLVRASKDSGLILGLLILAFIARFLIVFSFPNLSDDIYRFIWDGKMIHEGVHPLSHLPSEFVTFTGPEFKALYPYLNSPDYHTVYPPIHQAIFYIATIAGSWSTAAIVMKSMILCFEMVSLFFIVRMLSQMNKAPWLVLIYALNPLVIIELTGNAHFEGVMITFVCAGLYFLWNSRTAWSGALFALAVATKLIPLIFLPALLVYLKNRGEGMKRFITSFGVTATVCFIPYFWGLDIGNFLSSMDLYFQRFEFNGSIYLVLREVGYWLTGYNQIAVLGPFLGLLSMVLIIWCAFKIKDDRRGPFVSVLWLSLIIYLLFTTTVHPWYLAMGLALSVFLPSPAMILWTFMAIVSYACYAVADLPVGLLISVEYILVVALYMLQKKYPPGSPDGYFHLSEIKRN